MKCKDCGTKYKMFVGGQGCPDSPRNYLYVSAVGIVLFLLGILLNNACGFGLLILGGIAFIVAFLYSFSAAKTADFMNEGYKAFCPKCGKFNKARIWDN